jgi:hypothetical protein
VTRLELSLESFNSLESKSTGIHSKSDASKPTFWHRLQQS